jgi:hypothetical protein
MVAGPDVARRDRGLGRSGPIARDSDALGCDVADAIVEQLPRSRQPDLE